MISRRGIMLLEVGVAITASAALLYGAVFLFSSFQRIDRTARERVQMSRELTRLAEQFRRDVHAAREVDDAGDQDTNLAGGKSLVRLAGAENERVEYAISENRQLVRTLAKAAQVARREVFDLGPGVDYSIDVESDRITLVTLVVTLSGEADAENNAPKRQRRITALISRDGRYQIGMRKNGSP